MSRRRRDSEERGGPRRRSRSRSPAAETQRFRRSVQEAGSGKIPTSNVHPEHVEWNQSDERGGKTLSRRPEFDKGNDAGRDRDRDWRGRREDKRENFSFGAQRDDSFRSQPSGRFERGALSRGNYNNTTSFNDRRFESRGGGNFPAQSRPGLTRGNYPSGGFGGYGAGGSEFGQRRGGGRFMRGRGAPDRGTIVYRPGEEDETPKLNLFDPTKVPKGRSYFSHDDRERDDDRWSWRPARGRGRPYGWRTDDDRGGAPMPVRRRSPTFGRRPADDVWKHDKFDEVDQDTDNSAVDNAKAFAHGGKASNVADQ